MDSDFFTWQKYGGVTRYLVKLGEQLTEMGHDVKIHGLLHVNRHLSASQFALTRMHHIDAFPRLTRRITHLAGDLLSEMEFKLNPPDIIHESYYPKRPIGGKKLPRVCTVHDMIHELYPEIWPSNDRTAELKRSAILRADAVICVSENTRKDLVRLTGIDPEKTHVIHHGFELPAENTQLTTEEIRIMEDATSHPYLLYVGNRDFYKNYSGFIRGLAASGKSGDIRVVAFGGGSLSASELAVATELGIPEGHIRQFGGSDNLLRQLYSEAVAFVYPSRYEGFGFPPLEAMSMGCPVLASSSSCIPEILGEAAFYFDPGKSDEIAHGISRITESKSLRVELVQKGYDRIKKFSWEKCSSETLQVYQNAIDSK